PRHGREGRQRGCVRRRDFRGLPTSQSSPTAGLDASRWAGHCTLPGPGWPTSAYMRAGLVPQQFPPLSGFVAESARWKASAVMTSARVRSLALSLVVACALLVSGRSVLDSQQALATDTPQARTRPLAPSAIAASAAFSGRDLAALPRGDWLKNGGNLFNQNYSPLASIKPETVSNLKTVLRTHLGSGPDVKHSGEAQPVVPQGVIFVVPGADAVCAVSVKTGTILWKHEAGLPNNITTICCGWTSRGVALGDGRVYVGQLDGRLVALDQRS